jgi:hypothetical protein
VAFTLAAAFAGVPSPPLALTLAGFAATLPPLGVIIPANMRRP